MGGLHALGTLAECFAAAASTFDCVCWNSGCAVLGIGSAPLMEPEIGNRNLQDVKRSSTWGKKTGSSEVPSGGEVRSLAEVHHSAGPPGGQVSVSVHPPQDGCFRLLIGQESSLAFDAWALAFFAASKTVDWFFLSSNAASRWRNASAVEFGCQ